jgi:hypothetical protein
VDAANGAPLALAGALVADGSGNIKGGTMDVIDIEVPAPTPVAQPITGSYRVSADGRGQASLNSTAYGTFVLDFVLTSGSHGLVTEFDGNGTGSGTIDLQTALTGIGQIAGPYAFSLAGIDSDGQAFASAGAFTLNSNGTTTNPGIQDFNDNGVQFIPGSLAVTASLGSGTGPGAMTLNANFGPLQFDFYPIDNTHFKLIETDYFEFLAGDAFNQPSASIPTGPMVFTMSGGTSAPTIAPIANGGTMTSDGAGNFSDGLEDVNNSGDVPPQLNFTGTLNAGASGPTGGRTVVTLNGFFPAIQWVLYPSSGGLLMLEIDQASVTNGVAYAQQNGAAIASGQNYGFNLGAFNISPESEYFENDIAQFLTTSTTFSGTIDISDNYGPGLGVSLGSAGFAGNYAAAAPGNGRYQATTTVNGGGYVSFDFYAVSNDQFLLLETDSIQIGGGLFQLQSAPSGSVAQSHIALAHPIVLRPGAKSRLASRHKQAPSDRVQ